HVLGAIVELKRRRHAVEVLFVEANEEVLIRRYHETRRRHPLGGEGNVLDAIRAERKAMAHMREIADRIVDTSTLTVHQFRAQLIDLYGTPKEHSGLAPSLGSFGFK